MAIDKDMLDQLLAGRDPQDLFAMDGLLDELKKALSERMLSAAPKRSATKIASMTGNNGPSFGLSAAFFRV